MAKPLSTWLQICLSIGVVLIALAALENRERLSPLLGGAEEVAPRPSRAQTGVPVIVAPVGMARDDVVLEVVGTGRAARSVMLRSEDAGKITRMALGANARFRAGEVLLELEDTTQRLQLELAETRLAEAERVKTRFSRLQGSGTASTARLEEVLTEEELARLEVEQAKRALAERVLRAPFDGVSGLPSVEQGSWIDSDVEIASFDDRSALLVEFDLPEAALARVSAGLLVEALTPAFPGRVFEGAVTAIDSRIDPASRTAKLRVSIPNEADLLRPGASFTIRLALPGGDYPVVPELAVQFTRGDRKSVV